MKTFSARVIGYVLALTLVVACDSGIPRTYRGRFVTGFETNMFSPCGRAGRWWVEMYARSAAFDSALHAASKRASRLELSRIAPPLPAAQLDSLAELGVTFNSRIELYLEVRGRLSPRGRYGHLGGYDRQLRIESVRSVGPWDEVMCE